MAKNIYNRVNTEGKYTHPISANWQWKEADIYPETTDVREQIKTMEVNSDPRLYG